MVYEAQKRLNEHLKSEIHLYRKPVPKTIQILNFNLNSHQIKNKEKGNIVPSFKPFIKFSVNRYTSIYIRLLSVYRLYKIM